MRDITGKPVADPTPPVRVVETHCGIANARTGKDVGKAKEISKHTSPPNSYLAPTAMHHCVRVGGSSAKDPEKPRSETQELINCHHAIRFFQDLAWRSCMEAALGAA